MVRPCITDFEQVEIEVSIGFFEGIYVNQIVVQHLRHASNGAFDYYVAVEQLHSIRAVFEKAVELVDVLHGDLQTLVSKKHVLQTTLEILARALEEAVQLVDVLQQDIRNIRDRLLQMLV